MNIILNFIYDWEIFFCFKFFFVYLVVVFYIVVIVVVIIGNFMVCYVIFIDKNLCNNLLNLLFLFLVVVDFFMVIIVMLFDIELLFLNFVWKYGRVVCLMW